MLRVKPLASQRLASATTQRALWARSLAGSSASSRFASLASSSRIPFDQYAVSTASPRTLPTLRGSIRYSTSAASNDDAAHSATVNEDILAYVPKPTVKKVLIVGSGGLSIGQAGEFDYSGAQAIKAMQESGIKTVLVNPNIATIQTSHDLADTVYFLPVTPEYLEHVVERERPDAILLTFGGQTGLNCGIALDKMGVLDRYNVKVLGTPIRTLELSEDRHLFAEALKSINIPVAESTAVATVQDALDAAERIQYPVIIRSAFSLGGLGSGFAENEDELRALATKSLSLSPQILVERSMRGWKEIEYEVVRDAANNCITVCNMENFDPLGVHTGDSIVVAPSQTLSDEEYHMLRTAAIKIVRHMGVVGECNVQYALNPNSLEYCVIEMNARLSRSSALASKATGYPLAFVAAKIGLGYTLPELRNAVTKVTTAGFEPSLDYIVTKIPRWDLSKFRHVSRSIGSQMKSVGEVMAIGRTFEESLQKAIRMVDPGFAGFQGMDFPGETLDEVLQRPTDRRLFAVGEAMLNRAYSIDKIHQLTAIDKWFLFKLDNIAKTQAALKQFSLATLPAPLLKEAKQRGFSDPQIAALLGDAPKEDDVRASRIKAGIIPFVKQIDTLAAEFPAATNYLYTTYNAQSNDVEFNEHGTMVLGSGVYRIGSSVEFDWCGVSCVRALRSLGRKTVVVNYNPETVSTDFDESDRLYFEELSYERVKDIYEREAAAGVVVSVGGQLPQNIALRLHNNGAKVLGTCPTMIDSAEDRYKFSQVLDRIGVDQPEWKELSSLAEARAFAESVGYPVLIRPSYVLSGAAMNVAYTPEALDRFLGLAADISPDHPVVMTKFYLGAQEIDVDAVASKGTVLCHAVSEHVEQAGVHSGDATLILPSRELPSSTLDKIRDIACKIAGALEITGPFNMQIIRQNDTETGEQLKVIECNLRASRSFPFSSKVLDVNFIDVATRALVNIDVPKPVDLMKREYPYQAVKVAQFSWTRLQGADPFLGVEMASTGEVASFGKDKYQAYLTALVSTNGFVMPKESALLSRDGLTDDDDFEHIARVLSQDLGHKIYADTAENAQWLQEKGVNCEAVPELPFHDKRGLRATMEACKIDFVVSLARERVESPNAMTYLLRRAAVDFGLPLLNDSKCARLFVDALVRKRADEVKEKAAGTLPGEVRSWRDFISQT